MLFFLTDFSFTFRSSLGKRMTKPQLLRRGFHQEQVGCKGLWEWVAGALRTRAKQRRLMSLERQAKVRLEEEQPGNGQTSCKTVRVNTRDTPKISEAPIWVKSKDLLRGVSRDNTVLILQLNASVQWVPGGSLIYPCILTIQHSLLHIVGSQETLAECLRIQTKSQAMLASVWCQFCLFLPSASELHFHPAHFSDPNK